MKGKQEPRHDEVRELLRRGDPAGDGRDLESDETARMRRRVVSAAATRRAPAFRLIPLLAASALVVVMVAIGWSFLRPESPVAPGGAESVAAPDPAEPERRTRRIQFSTQGGTRIIWLLDSEFEV